MSSHIFYHSPQHLIGSNDESFPALPMEVVYDTPWASDVAAIRLEIARLRSEIEREREISRTASLDASSNGFACNGDKTLPIPGIDFDFDASGKD